MFVRRVAYATNEIFLHYTYLSTITTLECETCSFVNAYCHSECPIDNQIVYVIDISVNMNVSNCIGNFYHNSIFL